VEEIKKKRGESREGGRGEKKLLGPQTMLARHSFWLASNDKGKNDEDKRREEKRETPNGASSSSRLARASQGGERGQQKGKRGKRERRLQASNLLNPPCLAPWRRPDEGKAEEKGKGRGERR